MLKRTYRRKPEGKVDQNDGVTMEEVVDPGEMMEMGAKGWFFNPKPGWIEAKMEGIMLGRKKVAENEVERALEIERGPVTGVAIGIPKGIPKEVPIPGAPSAHNRTGYHTAAHKVAETVVEKQKAYGDSFGKAGKILEILYPNGVAPEQVDDMLAIVRIIDKMFRIATDFDAFGENPWEDLTGYALLALVKRQLKEGK